jgi:hypothetical protein
MGVDYPCTSAKACGLNLEKEPRSMRNVNVYCARPAFASAALCGRVQPSLDTFDDTHTFLRSVSARGLETTPRGVPASNLPVPSGVPS